MMEGYREPSGMDASKESDEFLSRAIRFVDGEMNGDELEAFNAELRGNESKLRMLAELQMQGMLIRQSLRLDMYEIPETQTLRPVSKSRRGVWVIAALSIAASSLFVYAAYWFGRSNQELHLSSPARLVNAAKAKFFGEFVPPINSLLDIKRDYVLVDGMVELSFPSGASAIIDAPAIFRIVDAQSLAVDAGRCSVHAPDGAEGFYVDTPTTRVVDRGTRFLVSVNENASTEVQVIEGAADVYPGMNSSSGIRLVDKDAQKFSATANTPASIRIPFNPDHYLHSLPDRVLGYEVASSDTRGAERLQSVSVQRSGKRITYTTTELIPVELTHFKAGPSVDPNGHFAGGTTLPNDRLSLLSDTALNTGIINPGGSPSPLIADPTNETPGFAIRFAEDVVNGPGPDVVLFELQSLTNPIDGDAFHVSPTKFTPSLRSHTVRVYDLTLTSHETKTVASFSLHRFAKPVESLNDLLTLPCVSNPIRLSFRVVVLGIDLSDLGYAEGDSVKGLFFQDAMDDLKNFVDPVFIAGLPRQ